MGFGRTENGGCAECPVREMIIIGCCTQGHMPEGLEEKIIVNNRGHRVKACAHLDPRGKGNRCMHPDPPTQCYAFWCGK